MQTITLRFSSELDFFLAPAQRGQPISFPLVEEPAVKHPIESLGVPHTEVGLIAVNSCPVDFTAVVRAGDQVMVYGIEDAPPRDDAALLRPAPHRPPRFVVDTHLGRLASYLRLLGLDTLYRNDFADANLAAIAAGEERVLLSRDRGLLKRKIVVHGYCVRDTDPPQQLVAVVRRYGLADDLAPYTRCVRCNGLLKPVAKADVFHLLEPKTRLYFEEFQQCGSCGQVFWPGSHVDRIRSFVDRVLGG